MNIPFFNLNRQIEELANELSQAIQSVMDGGTFISGKEVLAFEDAFADYLGAAHCITCANGTDAIELVLQAYGIGVGDEVIIPDYGWVSPYTAVKRSGAVPVVVDVELDGNIDLKCVERVIGSKTKAIIPIHLYGNPCKILELSRLCHSHGVLLIEDCAQAHGAEVGGKKVGTFGDAAIFSFYPTKNLGCMGDAGAVVTHDKLLALKVRQLGDYGRTSRNAFELVGRNSRMDELQAAILSVKLPYLDKWNQTRKGIARVYWEALGLDTSDFPDASVFYQFTLKVDDRVSFQKNLLNKGVQTDVHFPFTISGAFGLKGSLQNSTYLSERIISLPIYPELTETEILYICEQLNLLKGSIL